jgi:hypothetical protein
VKLGPKISCYTYLHLKIFLGYIVMENFEVSLEPLDGIDLPLI